MTIIGYYKIIKKERGNKMNNALRTKKALFFIKILLSLSLIVLSIFSVPIAKLFFYSSKIWDIVYIIACFILPSLLIPLMFLRRKWISTIFLSATAMLLILTLLINNAVVNSKYNEVIDTSPNIYTDEYLPFDEDSKIVKLDKAASLELSGELPIIDGAAAVFPVYSAFVNATYPNTTELYDGVFEYNNTSYGYELLAEKKTDIFFGAYPSKEQIAYADENSTQFKYTAIGAEAFVFFVNKENPVNNLTTEQIQKIYSGEITNWKDVGGYDEEITAFQRNQGSGSQSMLIRFMDGKEIMPAPTEQVNDWMSGIVEDVAADYKNSKGAIGFSFRYYLEGIIKNPNIKMLSIDGVAPSIESIKSGTYPITTSLYAVTYQGNDNPNVDKLLNWVLSDEGQYIIEQTGYVGIKKK